MARREQGRISYRAHEIRKKPNVSCAVSGARPRTSAAPGGARSSLGRSLAIGEADVATEIVFGLLARSITRAARERDGGSATVVVIRCR